MVKRLLEIFVKITAHRCLTEVYTIRCIHLAILRLGAVTAGDYVFLHVGILEGFLKKEQRSP